MARPTSLRDALPGLRRTLRRLSPYLRPHRRLAVGGVAAVLAEVALRLLEPWPLKFVLDRVLAPGGAGAGALSPTALVVLCAVGVVVVVGLRALASYLSTVAFALAGNRVLTAVREDLFAHLQRLSLRYHATARSGDLITRVTGDVGRLSEVAVTAALPLLANVATFVGMLAVMAVLDLGLTLAIALTFPLFALSLQRGTGAIRSVARRQRETEGALASVAAESFSSQQLVQTYGLEGTLGSSFQAASGRSLKDGVKGARLAAGMERRTDVIVGFATGVVLLVGARRVLDGALSPGDLVVFTTYLKNAFKPMRDLAKYAGRLAKASASGERIVDVLDTSPEVTDSSWARGARRFRGDVRLRGVRFSYGSGEPALDGLDLHVHPGRTLALVGPSGAGKSSVLSLLPRLYDPDDGVVEVDGIDVRDLTLESLRSQMAVVLQDSLLFADTIRENIAHGRPDASDVSDAEIEAAARVANAHDFVSALPDGYDTAVGERGATLSGGQRQRIAIARAVLRDAPVVLLDEPLTGLAPEQAAEVGQALTNLCRGRTVLLVTHDLEAARSADVIAYVESGRVVEQGTHVQLLGQGGPYAAQWRASRPQRPVPPVPPVPPEEPRSPASPSGAGGRGARAA